MYEKEEEAKEKKEGKVRGVCVEISLSLSPKWDY